MRSLRENIDVELRFAQLGPTDRRLELVRTDVLAWNDHDVVATLLRDADRAMTTA
jgi:hypothetical protein